MGPPVLDESPIHGKRVSVIALAATASFRASDAMASSQTDRSPMPPSPAPYLNVPAPGSRSVIFVAVFVAALATANSGCSSNAVTPSPTPKRNPVFVPPVIQVPDGISVRALNGDVPLLMTGWGVTGLTPNEPLHRYLCWSGEENELTQYCENWSVAWGHNGSALTFTTGVPFNWWSYPGQMSWLHAIAILGIPYEHGQDSPTLTPGPFPASSPGHEVFVKTVPSHINFF